MNEIAKKLRGVAGLYARAAEEVLGENLVAVALFGSVARGEASPDSDVDLFIVCRELPHGAFRRQKVIEPVWEKVQAEADKLQAQGIATEFTEIICTAEEAQRFRWFYLDMTEEVVLLFDREGFFARILENLRLRLKELGARRLKAGKRSYWDLKPDLQPGEVIEI